MSGMCGEPVTLSRMSQSIERLCDECLITAQFSNRGFGEEDEWNGAAARGQPFGGYGIAHDGRGLLQTAVPVRLACVAEHEAVAVEARGAEHRLRRLEESWPCGSDADQRSRGNRQPPA